MEATNYSKRICHTLMMTWVVH